MNIFEQANQIERKVAAGEIGGAVSWPLEGEATLLEVGSEYKKGNPYITFKMRHPVKGTQTFLVRIPTANDKDGAKFMAMQRIYATVYAAADVTAGSKTPEETFNILSEDLKSGEITVKYVLSEYTTISQQTGKEFVNQSLESLTPIDSGDFN